MSGKGLLTAAALVLLLLVGLNLRLTGIAAPSLHPDEPTIARWMASYSEKGELTERLYAGGFFKLAAPVRTAARAWVRHGAARAYQTGATDRITLPWDDIPFARRLNVALGLLTGLCIFFLALQVTGSRLAALAAAAFCLLNAVHVEHCHYAETDAAMLFLLALTLMLWARSIFTAGAFYVLGGAFAAGFAAGTKFPMLLLVIPALIIPFVSRKGDRNMRNIKRTWWLAGLSLLLFVAAFAWTNPAVLHPARFMESLANQSRGLQAEMSLTLGASGQSTSGQILWRLSMLQKHAADAGLLPLVLAAAGLIASLAVPRFRKAWPVLLLTPLLLLALNLFASPFIRKQEFMAFLPFLAVLAVLPLALPWPSFPSGTRIMKSGALAITLAALLLACLDASRVEGLFGWKDPRLMARDWNALHAPEDKRVAAENAASEAAEGSFGQHLALRHVADLREGITLLERFPVDYLIRDDFAKARGTTNPFTGRLRPRNQPLLDLFKGRSILLKTWGPFPFPKANASYAGHTTMLYAMDSGPAAFDLHQPLEEPIFLSEAGRETAFTGDLQLGGREAVRLTDMPREMALGGSGSGVDRLWVTLIPEEEYAKVRLTAWGRTVTLRVSGPTDVCLEKPWWHIVPEPYARVKASTKRGACLMRLGRLSLPPGKAGELDRALSLTNGVLAIDGIPEQAYNAFARIRDLAVRDQNAILDSDKIRKRDNETLRSLKTEQLRRLGRDLEKTCLSVAPYRPPFRLPRGRYALKLLIQPLPVQITGDAEPADADRFELTNASGQTLYEGRWTELSRDRDTSIQLAITAEKEEALAIYLVTPVPRTLSVRGAELTWTLRDRLLALRPNVTE
jgi:hypothetical protein